VPRDGAEKQPSKPIPRASSVPKTPYSLPLSRNDEIRPEWFAISSSSECIGKLSKIPFAEMFPDNRHWVPLLASGKPFIGRCDYSATKDKDGVGKLLRYWIATV
jgi:hypothetical protein